MIAKKHLGLLYTIACIVHSLFLLSFIQRAFLCAMYMLPLVHVPVMYAALCVPP